MDTFDGDTKITVTLKNKGNLLANVTVSINTVEYGFVTIKGFQIWRSRFFNERLQGQIHIQPISMHAYGKYYPQIFFEKPDSWFDLEQKIYDAFNLKRNGNADEDIDLDEVEKGINQSQEKKDKDSSY